MTIQHARLTSLPVEIAVADTPRVLSKITVPTCIAAVWRRHPLASFQTWLDDLSPAVLPQARLILRPEAVHDAIAHLCRQAGMPDGPERSMLAGDIAALAHIFADVASCDYLRVRLELLDGLPDFTQHSLESTIRLVCVYRGPRLTIGQTATEGGPDVTISSGVPFVLREESPKEFRSNVVRCRGLPTVGAPLTSLVLTLDPVSTPERTPDLNAGTYH